MESAEEMGDFSVGALSVTQTVLGGFVKYVGLIRNTHPDHYGWIGIDGVTRDDGSPHGLETEDDIYVNQADAPGLALAIGLEVTFEVVPDPKRSGAFRAEKVWRFQQVAMIPVGEEPAPGLVLRREFPYLQPEQIAYLLKMKSVPATVVAQAQANAPLEGVPHVQVELTADQQRQLCEGFLRNHFPMLSSYSADASLADADDASLDEMVSEARETMRSLGFVDQIPVLEDEVGRFKRIRASLTLIWKEGLVRPDAIIPIANLADLVFACPVVYFWAQGDTATVADESWNNDDPDVHPVTAEFCDIFKSEVWRDFFQMYNRRIRTLKHYKGETIPAHILRRMKSAVELFDWVAILTPYHDVAGKEWRDPEWQRAIDPYIIGFHRGLPYFFVLGRYSDAGTFPLLNELVADTVGFLKANRKCLVGFSSPYWYEGVPGELNSYRGGRGNILQTLVDRLLVAFEGGYLFPWLRGEVNDDGSVVTAIPTV
jgi:hypothetical protein